MNTLAKRLLQKLGRGFVTFVAAPASPRPLAALRIGVAGVLLLQAFTLAGHLFELFGNRGVIQWQALPFQPPEGIPNINGLARLLAPLGVSADTSVRLVFFSYVASLVMLLLGWQTRVAAVVAWLTQMALKTTGEHTIYGVDEFAHIALFYCVWMPVGFAWSLDRQNGKVSDEPTALARLGLRVLQLHLCVVYFSSGVEKATGEQWWNGEAIWRSVMRLDLGMVDISWMANVQWLAMALCWGTLVVEMGYVFMIWHRRTRLAWAVATIGLHAGIAVFLGLWSFGALMIALNVAALCVPATVTKPAVATERKGVKGAALAGAAA